MDHGRLRWAISQDIWKSIIFGLKPKTCEWYADVTTEGYEHGNTLGLYRCYHYGLFMWSRDFTYNDKEWFFFLRKIGFGKTWVLTLRHPTNPCRREADQRFAGTSVVKHKDTNISKRTSFQSRLSFCWQLILLGLKVALLLPKLGSM